MSRTPDEIAHTRLIKWLKQAYADTPTGSTPNISQRSSLARDHQLTSPLTTSQLAWIGISAAREHLNAAARVWRSHDADATMPTAYGTLLRTAAVGAANAYWRLAPPSRPVRVARTMALAEENYRRAVEAIEEAHETAKLIPGFHADLIARETPSLHRWHERRDSARQQLAKSIEPHRFNQTRVLRWVGSEILHDDPSGGGQSAFLWRLTSGDSHALTWQRIIRARASGALAAATPSGGETVILRDVQSEQRLLLLVEFAMVAKTRAESLFQARST